MGRRSDILRVRGLFVQPKLVASVLAENGFVGRHRMVVDRPGTFDRLRVIVESPEATADQREHLVRQLKSVINLTCEVELAPPGSIDPSLPVVEDQRTLA
ncbi:MAG: hypothetical protein IRY95_10310 [Clostridia bacterium]|nr:hypothetical protein [Clostridia bacterium]